ncbi:DUF1444 domain-containing protein [Salipaludibacillus neizhouensis]|uniref:DUF1444 domain-containing protein n=1 Tax=Salipaludibacillus neizhouensis TaxID=885475 RepID=A0A3A9KGP5_9BACI|nr:DUF1444 domain-containing protein [Salipaludibacillus neizhouensis]RKL66765.1 DUF1444 domain-containing protein [Salipaludibacillus neizhouensis]
MKPIQMKREIEAHLTDENWVISFDREQSTLRVVDKRVDKGVTIQLSNLTEKFESDKEKTLTETVHSIKEGLRLLTAKVQIAGNEKNIFPVVRSTSFPTELEDGRKLVFTEHTAETKIFYAVDQGASYSLIDEGMLEDAVKTVKEIKETGMFNLRSLNNPMKEDNVAGNTFYFIRTDDGYDASRIMNETLLKEMNDKVLGELAIAVPHHDVLIFADIRNETGYDILGQMTFQFFSEGRVPLTALPFMYKDGELEPIFILARKKPKET